MQQSIGEIIRQVRQLRNLTQRAVGGDRFSKSYVSAVEHNRIAPSKSALRFFAQQLGQPNGDFVALLQQPDVAQALSLPDLPALLSGNGHIKRDEIITLLDTLLEHTALSDVSPHRHLPTLAPDALASLPQHVQARYYFRLGLQAKEQRNPSAALRAFESALALTPAHRQAAILDEMGSCFLLLHSYLTALGYHLHARHMLAKAPASDPPAPLHLAIELHCGQAYRALGAYHQALAHYEAARTHLSAHHDLAAAAALYSGLGYCTYAALSPNMLVNRYSTSAPAPPALSSQSTPEQVERAWQQAIGFFLQSRNFYQVSGDRLGEASVRLTLTSVLLDLSAWRRGMMTQRARQADQRDLTLTDCVRLLDDAAEQCQQVLLGWQVPGVQAEGPPTELDTILYGALTCLIRISVQRAILARWEGSYLDAAYRERAFAAYLCQQVLGTLATPAPPWAVIQQALTYSAETLAYRSPSLPRLTEIPGEGSDASSHSLPGLIEVYMAAGEVAEELGRAASVPNYAHDCYSQATQYLQAALSLARLARIRGGLDPGSLTRLYERCIALLQERNAASPALDEETTKALLGVLNEAFWQLQRFLPEDKALEIPPQDQV